MKGKIPGNVISKDRGLPSSLSLSLSLETNNKYTEGITEYKGFQSQFGIVQLKIATIKINFIFNDQGQLYVHCASEHLLAQNKELKWIKKLIFFKR